MLNAAKDNDISLDELNEYIGKHVSTLVMHKGKDYYPTMRTFIAICNAFDFDPRAFFTMTDEEGNVLDLPRA